MTSGKLFKWSGKYLIVKKVRDTITMSHGVVGSDQMGLCI